MLQTVEAVIDQNGKIHLLEKLELNGFRRALVTVLNESPKINGNHESIVGLGEVIDEDLEAGSREIAEMFNRAIEKSAREVGD